jgi:hypothetical protein
MPSLCGGASFHLAALCTAAHSRHLKRRLFMSDIIALLYGVVIFALLFLYVPLTERV